MPLRLSAMRAVTPVYARHIAFHRGGKEFDVFAMALAISSKPSVHASSFVPVAGTIDVDRVLAAQAGVGIGDAIQVLGHRLVVSAIHSGGDSIFQTAFLNAADARALFGIDDYTNFLLLDVAPGANVSAVAAAVQRALPGTETHTSDQFATSFANLRQCRFSIRCRRTRRAWVRRRRSRDRAHHLHRHGRARPRVRRAQGSRSLGGFLYRVVVRQSLIVGVLGAVVGIVSAVVATRLIRNSVPEFITVLRPLDACGVFVVAVLMAIAAS